MALSSCYYLIVILLLVRKYTFANEQSDAPIVQKGPESAEVMVESYHIFHCKTSPAGVTVEWKFQNATNYVTSEPGHQCLSRYCMLHKANGSLSISRTLISNIGNYWCVAKDEGTGREDTSTKASLRVDAPVKVVTEHSSPPRLYVQLGRTARLHCEVIAFPPPSLVWRRWEKGRKGTTTVTIMNETTAGKVYSGKTLSVGVTSSPNYVYECEGENYIQGRPYRARHTIEVVVTNYTTRKTTTSAPPVTTSVPTTTTTVAMTTTDSTVQTSINPSSQCVIYTGSVCRNYLKGRVVYYKPGTPLARVEEAVLKLMEDVLSHYAQGTCLEELNKLVCHSAFPDCTKSNVGGQSWPVCREDCLAISSSTCFSIWPLLTKQMRCSYTPLTQFPMTCQGLPSRYNTSCTDLHLFPRHSSFTDDCYRDKGRYYNGTVNITRSGHACQSWSASHPHAHNYDPAVFMELPKLDNFCRNPGDKEDRPYCFTVNKTVRWEYCDIPKCDKKFTTPFLEDSGQLDVSTTLLVITMVVSSMACIMFVLVVVMWRRMNHRAHTASYNRGPRSLAVDISLDEVPDNEGYLLKSAHLINPKLEKLEYPRNDIVYLCDIGQGAFGSVFKARCPDIVDQGISTPVAVKMLRMDATEEMQEDFECEASLMAEFDHMNIVKLLGVCAIGKPMCLLFEYMTKGALNEFLRHCSPEHFIVRQRGSMGGYYGDTPKLDHMEQIHIAQQIANGMAYLSRLGYVHRDLATRNCLVGHNLCIKISDFALAHKLDGDYYHGDDSDAVPIRWMPMESIFYNMFSVESDVWSFGVVLWEIFSFGVQPYYGLSHEQVINYLQEGRVLSCPDNTPQEIYDLMCMCWSRKPSTRPVFTMLYRSLNIIKETLINAKLQASPKKT